MVRRLLVLVSALTLLIPSAVFAENPTSSDRFTTLPGAGPVDPQVLPNAMNDSRPVTVMLEMRGDPVAVVQSEAPGKKLSKAQKAQIKAELKGRQDAIKDDIAANGGRVLSQLQSAYNGVKVNAPRNKVAALAALPNVIAVRGVQIVERDNHESIPFLGIPDQVWDPESGLGMTGEGVKIAVIDTGIDYTHANFGGPGTEEAYELADSLDTTVGDAGDAGLFGDGAPKVKGGTDLVGDAYDAEADDPADQIPQPDPDPLDCPFTSGSVGHGSHVSGTATGLGVLADGTTYPGPYDADTLTTHEFAVGPGVAPEADLYFVRVFGCQGSTDVTVDAIDWAVDNDMDVINMSLGSSFGRADDPSAVASTNAAAAGVSVVTSAGNSGPSPYITGSPGTGTGAIATAAIDSHETLPGVDLDLEPGGTIKAVSANGIVPDDGTTYNVVILTDDPATTDEDESLGCSVEANEHAGIVEGGNQLAVSVRGTCARVARAIFAEQAGAAAAAMINSTPGYPPFEGPILSNPDDGTPFEVTIPFLGIQGPPTSADATALRGAATATTTGTTLTNPGFRGFASFSSGGPRNGDSFLKPDIAAPGVSILSTAAGTGNKGYFLSGTSMASPHVAGIAALVRQAHPDWTPEEVKAAIVNSGDPGAMVGYRTTRAGSGLVTPAVAVGTDVVALGDMVAGNPTLGLADFHNANLSFGFDELGSNFSATHTITVVNDGDAAVTLAPSAVASGGSSPASLVFNPTSVTVPAGGTADIAVTLNVPASTAGNANAFRHVSGNVVLSGDDTTLRVPYLLVPRALSNITTSGTLAKSAAGTTFTSTNPNGAIAGTVDVYQWGLQDADDVNEGVFGGAGYDMRAAGVQSFDAGGGDRLMVFALNTHDRWSTAAVNEYDIVLDTNRDGTADWVVIGFDHGALTTGSFDGIPAVFLLNLATNQLSFTGRAAFAPTDGSTYELTVFGSEIGLTSKSRAFNYVVQSFSLEGAGADAMSGSANFDPWRPELTGGFPFETVPPAGEVQFALGLSPSEKSQGALGAMIVSVDNASGAGEAQLIGR
ncbi:MAG TPA: S8 family serine peptidase [Candidatus Limnocylindria bacterium]|nr:S8 family serine peptidase [Candidatus Limnocylindria bacterium]